MAVWDSRHSGAATGGLCVGGNTYTRCYGYIHPRSVGRHPNDGPRPWGNPFSYPEADCDASACGAQDRGSPAQPSTG